MPSGPFFCVLLEQVSFLGDFHDRYAEAAGITDPFDVNDDNGARAGMCRVPGGDFLEVGVSG